MSAMFTASWSIVLCSCWFFRVRISYHWFLSVRISYHCFRISSADIRTENYIRSYCIAGCRIAISLVPIASYRIVLHSSWFAYIIALHSLQFVLDWEPVRIAPIYCINRMRMNFSQFVLIRTTIRDSGTGVLHVFYWINFYNYISWTLIRNSVQGVHLG